MKDFRLSSLFGAFLLINICSGARILGIFPLPIYSHQQPFRYLMKIMAERGHEVTDITSHPLKEPPPNYRPVDISSSIEVWKSSFDFNSLSTIHHIDLMRYFAETCKNLCEYQMKMNVVQELFRENSTYDLVLFEMLDHHCFMGLVQQLGYPPMIAGQSLGAFATALTTMGNPNNPAYSPDSSMPYTDHMTFLERIQNLYRSFNMNYILGSHFTQVFEPLMKKYYGSDFPSVPDIEKNISLLFLSNSWVLNYPRAYFPNVIELTGLHVNDKPSPLPKDIQEFIDSANDGVIYISFGSNVKSSDFPPERRITIVKALSQLPQRIIWKWESETFPDKPDNIMTKKWIPQQDLLAHPNVKLFITQGGLQSLQEATYHAVPLLVIPFLGDQGHNARKVEDAGIGRQTDFLTMTTNSLLNDIRTIISDKRYEENMEELSSVFRDHRAKSLQDAVWWMEFVIKHKGAKYLRPATLDLNWYQYLMLDIVLIVIAVTFTVVLMITCLVKLTIRCLINQTATKVKIK